jgi:hypothetical protein
MGLTLAVLLTTSFVKIRSFYQFDLGRRQLCIAHRSVLASRPRRNFGFEPVLPDPVQLANLSGLDECRQCAVARTRILRFREGISVVYEVGQ